MVPMVARPGPRADQEAPSQRAMLAAGVVPTSAKLPAITRRSGRGPLPSGSQRVDAETVGWHPEQTEPLTPGTPSPGSQRAGHWARAIQAAARAATQTMIVLAR